MTTDDTIRDYVSPIDERARPAEPLAARPSGIGGATIALLDITKNRGAEFLDQVESQLRTAGAGTFRISKEIFSKPAAPGVIDEVAARADLAVEALAD
ncbi:MAG: hypothetical protein LBV34_04300 [Nocardiopsaceae bacterium]|nr:hypothetical protein [Nocardiopsaceae bacterium]